MFFGEFPGRLLPWLLAATVCQKLQRLGAHDFHSLPVGIMPADWSSSPSNSIMNTASRSPRAVRFVVQSCAAVVGGGALAAASGWLVGHRSFTTFGAGYVPMPPSSAWLLVLLSVALWLHSRWPERRLSRLFGVGASTVTCVFSLLVIAHESGLVRLQFEPWLAFTTAPVDDIPVGRMSLHTTVTFLCAAGALGCLLGATCRPRWWRPPALVLATVVAGSGAVTILGYAAGMPLLYGSGYVPMALATAIALAVLGAGLMTVADPDNWLF